MNEEIKEIISYIEEIEMDSSVPRNIKAKLVNINNELKKVTEKTLSLTVNKLLSDLDEVSGDVNLDSFSRQQIWSITSMLEGIEFNE